MITTGITSEATTDTVETINDPRIIQRITSDTATEGDIGEQGVPLDAPSPGSPLFPGFAASSPDRPAIDIDADPVTGAPLAAAVLGDGRREPDPVAVAAAVVAQASAELTTGAPCRTCTDAA